MPWGWASAAVSLVGSLASAAGQRQAGAAAAAQGTAEQEAADFRAQMAGQQAGEAAAAGAHEAELAARDNAIALSNARARAAASGTTTSSEGIVSLLQKIAGRGAFAQEQQVAKGQTEAQNLENQAELDLFQGDISQEEGQARQAIDETDSEASIIRGAGGTLSDIDRIEHRPDRTASKGG
jgi:hypothetical protein